MLVIRENQVINLQKISAFSKETIEIDNSSFFRKDKNALIKHCIEFYFPSGRLQVARFVYDEKEDRNSHFSLIVESFNLGKRVLVL